MKEPGRSPRRRSRTVRRGGGRFDFDIPLVGPSGTLGVASVQGVKLSPFTDQLLQVMSFDLGGRLEQLRLLEVLGEQSFSDALTGVGNRRHADALTAQLSPGDAVLLIDLDHFKNVNDADGHRAGDRVLEELGAHLKSALRQEDSVARYGGDEFLIRLNPKDGSPEQIAQRLLTSWLQAGAAVSFSVGVAVHMKETDPLATFALADAALYEAKRSGRARICLAASSALPH
jgi:diguanylate cyclase